ncbi:MAG: T9SS type A sorting domain-containing protein [Saprospirales bacterium]|nr:T9SS type A sorting domain-containing protein [Saprospirales bacterium]MBK8922484.1 T9SS type A sorting domain-containing protein [Saprospirales bacterium]
MVYDFDRETGAFTHFDTISFKYGNQPVIGEIGCAVSPSGRFLYLGCRQLLHQLDLWAPDISASQVVVAEWDGVANPFATLFSQLQLGPDCKIYGLAGGDTRYFHVIHYPDEPGLACQVEQRGLPLPTPSGASMPSFPNYRLGPVDNPGLPCSPVVSAGAPPAGEAGVSVYPNPASDQLTFRYDPAENGDQTLFIFNNLGQLVLSARMSSNQNQVSIPTDNLSNGVYWYRVAGTHMSLPAGKFIVHR